MTWVLGFIMSAAPIEGFATQEACEAKREYVVASLIADSRSSGNYAALRSIIVCKQTGLPK